MRHKMASKQTATYILWGLIVVFIVGIFFMSNPGKFGTPKPTGGLPGSDNVIATLSGGSGTVWTKKITAGELNDKFDVFQKKADDPSSGQRVDVGNVLEARKGLFDQLVNDKIQEETVHDLGIHLFNWDLSSIATEWGKIQIARLHGDARIQAKMEVDQAAKVKPADKAKAQKPQTADEIVKQNEQRFAQQLDATADGSNMNDAKLIRLFVHKVMTKDDNDVAIIDNYAHLREIGKVAIKKNLPGASGVNQQALLSQAFVSKLNTKDVKASWIFVAATDQTAKGLQVAEAKAQQLHDQIVAKPDSFASVAKTQSNDPMTAAQGGSLGWMTYSNQNPMVQPSEYLAFSTEKNTVSPVLAMTLPSMFQQGPPKIGAGFVRVEDIRDSDNAKTFDWNKDAAGATLLAAEHFEVGFAQNYLALERGQSTVVRTSNELKYYDAQMSAPADAAKYVASMQTDPTLPQIVKEAFAYQTANQETDLTKKASDLEGIYESGFAGDQATNIKMSIGEAYVGLKQKAKAIETFQWVAQVTENADPTNVHQQLKTDFTKIGDTADAQAMDAWIKKHPQTNSGFGGGMPITMPAQQ
jgi:hypothetical protein